MKTIITAFLLLNTGILNANSPTRTPVKVMEIKTMIQFTDFGYAYTEVDEDGLSVHNMTFVMPIEIKRSHTAFSALTKVSAHSHRIGL